MKASHLNRFWPDVAIMGLVIMGMVFPASGLEGQVLAGQVLDRITDEPVRDADVVLLNEAGETVARAITNERGHFLARLDTSAILRVTVERIGYASGDTLTVVVPPETTSFLQLSISPEGVELPGITVTASRQTSWLGRRGFYDREKRGVGTFLEAEEIQSFRTGRITDVFRRIPGTVVRQGMPYFMRYMGGIRGDCPPTVLLDGTPVDPDFLEGSIPVDWVVGIEAYKNAALIPPQWRHFGGCGLVAVWTGF